MGLQDLALNNKGLPPKNKGASVFRTANFGGIIVKLLEKPND